jgi:hypothetical protein
MEKIKVNGVQYNIPTSWSDITLAQQIEISKVGQRDETFRNVHMISTYTGIPMDLIRRMNINDFKSILELLSFMAQPTDNKILRSFDHNEKTYFLADSILNGQTQDFLSVEGLLKKYKDNQVEALPYIIAIVAKQEKETLDDYDVYQRAEEFMNLPYSIAQNIWFFFVQTEKAYSLNIKQSLIAMDQVLETSLNYSENLVKQSDGQTWSRKLQKAILLLYIRSTRKSYRSFWTSIQSEPSKENWKQRFKKNISKMLKRRIKVK